MAWHGMHADGAMFDEVSEGTAYYKIASRKSDTPANAPFVYNENANSDADGGHGGHHEATEDPRPQTWGENLLSVPLCLGTLKVRYSQSRKSCY